MPFLSLSFELIEQIASYLHPRDLAALMFSCSQFRKVGEGSLLLQYIYRTGLAGVYDPLCDLSTHSIADRMEMLRRWEASWATLEKYLAEPQLVISMDRDPSAYGRSFLRNDYLFVVDSQGGWLGLRPSALLYVDLREALRTGQYLWKQIDYPQGLVSVLQAFSIEENDLVVSALSFPEVDVPQSKIMLQFTSLETGEAHPLATLPSIQVDTEWFNYSASMQIDIIGDQIVLILASMSIEGPWRELIYVGDWKEGRITLVHSAPCGTYAGAFVVLSSDLLLLVRRDTPSFEICRLASSKSSPRGIKSSGEGGTSTHPPSPTPSLRVVRTLALPAFNPACNIIAAHVDKDHHTERRSEPKMSPQHQEQEQGCLPRVRAPPPLPFHNAPEDMVIGIKFLVNFKFSFDLSLIRRSIVMTVSHSALFALAAEGHLPDGCQQRPISSAGDGACGQGEGKGTVERKQEQVVVPWEEWGPRAMCVPPLSLLPNTLHAGQRMFWLEWGKLVIHDFSAARVRRARTRSHHTRVSAERCEDTCQREEEATAAAAETVIQGGSVSFFKDDVVSSLPFIETHVDMRENPANNFLTDGERLIVFVRGAVGAEPMTFSVHVLQAPGQ